MARLTLGAQDCRNRSEHLEEGGETFDPKKLNWTT
jgi:hypothetical protein